jgi:hypothetical protein
VYESWVIANRDFLSMILFIIDLAVQTHLQYCLVCEDMVDVNVMCLDFSAAQSVVLNYMLFVNVPEYLRVSTKRPREESQAGPSGAIYAPGNISRLDRDNGRENQGTKVIVLNKKAKQELIVDEEKFKILQRHQKHCPKENQVDIGMQHHYRGFFYEGCNHLHAYQDVET